MRLVVLSLLVIYWKLNRYCEADWVRFASSTQYFNKQLVTNLNDFFPVQLISKETARLQCSTACKVTISCLAFNFYEVGEFYTCELLPDNFCYNLTKKALVHRNGSSVWEKLTGSMSRACVDQRYQPGSIPCEFLQPGCFGMWPNCSNCFKSCKDCYAGGLGTGYYNCTFWPAKNIPIFGTCNAERTYLFKRQVNTYTGAVKEDYRMRFSDFYQLYNLQIYKQFCLYFSATDGKWYVGCYSNWAIDENGTLLGKWLFSNRGWGISTDVLNFTGRLAGTIPFVQVTDDRYGCGSFWLLDENNSTYCPGGQTGQLGTVQKDTSGNVISTGVKLAKVSPGKTFYYATVELVLN